MRIFANTSRKYAAGMAAVFIMSGAGFGWGVSVAHAQPLSPSCALPDPLLSLSGNLKQTLRQMAEYNQLHVMAIGSSSTAGAGASTPEHAYPMQFKQEMMARFPHLKLTVDNLGINGEIASATIIRLYDEVKKRNPDLVIWQLGTNDAVRGISNETFRTQVMQTIDWLQENDVEVVLMNPQFYPKIQSDVAYAAVVDDLSRMAMRENVPMVNRFAAMQHWNSLPEDVRKHMLWRDEFHLNDQGYACVAQMLAEGIYRRSITEARVQPMEQKSPAGVQQATVAR